jgi:CRP-like cAMP-binding protein
VKDHPGENIFFVVEGIVMMTVHELNDVPIAIYRSGMVFGEFEVYKNTKRLFSCTSITPVKLLVLDKKKFKYIFFKSDPSIGKWFLSSMEAKFENLEQVMNKVLPLASLRRIRISFWLIFRKL